MAAIFLSHSSQDKDRAKQIVGWLQELHHHSVFLDLDTYYGLQGGEHWESVIYRNLRNCRALVALLSPDWCASRWCFAELTQARALGKTVIPLRISECDVTGIIADTQVISDLDADVRKAKIQLELALRNAHVEESFDWDASRVPFPGLYAFEENDAAVFCGRQPEIESCLAALERLAGHFVREDARLLLILGPSGSGKSSLMRAGVMPMLRRDTKRWRILRPLIPHQNVQEELTIAFAEGLSLHPDQVRYRIRRIWKNETPDPAPLLALVTEFRNTLSPERPLVLLAIDQTEIALSSGAEGHKFLAFLRAMLETSAGTCFAVATMRSDALGQFQRHPALQGFTAYEQFRLDLMPKTRFPELIEEPAQRANLDLEEGLVDTIVSDTKTADALPLLAFTLHHLYKDGMSAGERKLKIGAYDQLGGLEGAIKATAEREFKAVKAAEGERQAFFDAFVPHLVEIDSNNRFVRRRAPLSDLPPAAGRMIDRFVDSRLLTKSSDDRDTFVEVAHEALFTVWDELRERLRSDRENLILLRGLRRDAEAWAVAQGRRAKRAALKHWGESLKQMRTLVARPGFRSWIGPVPNEYLQACIRAQRRRYVAFGTVISAVILVLAVITGVARKSAIQARTAEQTSERRAEEAEALLIWQSLEFSGFYRPREINTLWELMNIQEGVRKAFLDHLFSKEAIAERFNRRPEPLARALVGFDDQRRQELLASHVLPNLKSSYASQQWQAAAYLGFLFGSDEFAVHEAMLSAFKHPLDFMSGPMRLCRMWVSTLPALDHTFAMKLTPEIISLIVTEPERWQLEALSDALGALPVQLTAAQQTMVVTALVQVAEKAPRAESIGTVIRALGMIKSKFSPGQTQEVTTAILNFMNRTTELRDLPYLAERLAESQVRLTAAQAIRAKQIVLDRINESTPFARSIRAVALAALATIMPADQVETMVQSLVDSVDKIAESDMYHFPGDLGRMPVKLTGDQAAKVVKALVEGIAGASQLYVKETLANDVRTVIGNVVADQIDRAIQPLIDALQPMTNFAEVFAEMPVQLTAQQALTAVRTYIASLTAVDNETDALVALGKEFGAVLGKVSPDAAAGAAQLMLAAVPGMTNPWQLRALAQGLAALPVKPNAQQLSALLQAFTDEMRAHLDPDSLRALCEGMGALPTALSDELAEAISQALMAGVNENPGWDRLGVIGMALGAIAGKLKSEQAAGVLQHYLEAIPKAANAQNFAYLGTGFRVLPPINIPPHQATMLADMASALLSRANTPEAAFNFARLIVAVTESAGIGPAQVRFAELLRYPMLPREAEKCFLDWIGKRLGIPVPENVNFWGIGRWAKLHLAGANFSRPPVDPCSVMSDFPFCRD